MKAFGDRDDIADAMFTMESTTIGDETVPGLGLNIVRYNQVTVVDMAHVLNGFVLLSRNLINNLGRQFGSTCPRRGYGAVPQRIAHEAGRRLLAGLVRRRHSGK